MSAKRNRETADLIQVVRDVLGRVLGGDWTRYSNEAGDSYYIIGGRAHEKELQEGRAFGPDLIPVPPTGSTSFEEWFVRAALAEEPEDRLKGARAKLKKVGGDPRQFDAAVLALQNAHTSEAFDILKEWYQRFPAHDRTAALFELLAAWRIEGTRKRRIFVSEKDRPQLLEAFQRALVRELLERLSKAVARASAWDWLAVRDPLLREACRCYLYGFFRATVVMAAATVEFRLRAITGTPWKAEGFYKQLAHDAFGEIGIVDKHPATAEALADLFTLRNEIIHKGAEPSVARAREAIELAREIMERASSGAAE